MNPAWGALGGFVVGLLVSLDLAQKAVRMLIAFAFGLLGVGVARRIYLDGGWDWFWASVPVLLLAVSIQLWLCVLPVREYWAAARCEWRWRTIVSAVVYALVVLITLGLSWVGAWHGEMFLRMRAVEERGGNIYLQWRPRTLMGRLRGPVGAAVSIHNPESRDWTTIRMLPTVMGLTISGNQADDDALAEMPNLTGVWNLSIQDSRITGRYLSRLPNVGMMTVHRTPLDDAAMIHVGRLQGLT